LSKNAAHRSDPEARYSGHQTSTHDNLLGLRNALLQGSMPLGSLAEMAVGRLHGFNQYWQNNSVDPRHHH
jgi:hypothetical protein